VWCARLFDLQFLTGPHLSKVKMNDKLNETRNVIRGLGWDIRPDDYWTHYKGGVYQIVSMGIKEDTLEPVVIYKSLSTGETWVRAVASWCEDVVLPTGTVKRFKRGAP
jgi:hypothetical protein